MWRPRRTSANPSLGSMRRSRPTCSAPASRPEFLLHPEAAQGGEASEKKRKVLLTAATNGKEDGGQARLIPLNNSAVQDHVRGRSSSSPSGKPHRFEDVCQDF